MNTDWTGSYICKERHKAESRWNHTTTDHKEGGQLEDRRNFGENSCNSGDGTDQTGPMLDVYDEDDDDDDVMMVVVVVVVLIVIVVMWRWW